MVKQYLMEKISELKGALVPIIAFFATAYFLLDIYNVFPSQDIKGMFKFLIALVIGGAIIFTLIESLVDGYRYAIKTISQYMLDIKGIQSINKRLMSLESKIDNLEVKIQMLEVTKSDK